MGRQNKNKNENKTNKRAKNKNVNSKLSCLYANARSIMNKRDELELYAIEHKSDIIGITETWANEKISDSELNLQGYTLFRKDRNDKKGGGVILYVENSLSVTVREELVGELFNESLWCEIQTGSDKTLVGICYRNPLTTEGEDDDLRKIMDKISKEVVVIMGDFNFSGINWDNMDGSNIRENKFIECVQDNFLTQHVQQATRGHNVLDLVITSEENLIENLEVKEPFGTSDHCIITWDLITLKTDQTNKGSQKFYNYFRADYAKIIEWAKLQNWNEIIKGENIDDDWNRFKTVIEEIVDKNIPLRKLRKKKYPWVTNNVIKCRRAKNKAWAKYLKVRTNKSYEKYKQKLNKSVAANKSAQIEFEKQLAKDVKTNSKSFYAYVHSKQRTKEKVGPLKDNSGEILKDDQSTATLLNDYFATVFTNEDKTNMPAAENLFFGEENEKLETIKITENMVMEKLCKMKTDKSPGVDSMHPKMIQELKTVIANPLARLFQNSLNKGWVPQDWRDANITALHKKGARAKSENYRPVSLTSIICKIYESIVKDEMIKHLEKFNLIKDSQHGFTKGRSCLTNLLEFFEEVTELLDKGNPVDIIYLDFAKAFDKVPHIRLIEKLKSLGITGKICQWIKAWLSNRRQRVVINGKYSEWKEVISGVPQGSVLGPILFLIFINDLDTEIGSKLCKFADDTKLCSAVATAEQVEKLREDLRKLCIWAKEWQMLFNEEKCVVMHIGKKNVQNEYEMNGVKLKETENERDLGVIISKNGKTSEQCLAAAKKGNSVLGMIKRNIKWKDKDTIIRLYKALVRPKLEYCVQAWCPYLKKDIEVLEKFREEPPK